MESIKALLKEIYGQGDGELAFKKILPLIEAFPTRHQTRPSYFSQEDVVLITYGDSLQRDGEAPLETLRQFTVRYLKGLFSTVHILPFFPFSSDDGFSVEDFYAVDQGLGAWDHIDRLGDDFNLMFDFVLNHISSQSLWFERFLNEAEGFESLAIEVDPSADLSLVTRPRALPLLTEFTKHSGETVHVWTTFSADQVDINFKSIDALKKMLDVLLLYVEKGASILRLDAIAYLWKEIGTSCIHLKQTHDIVKLFREILDLVAPDVMILTETNVPHAENISYYGDGKDEAQMVYNFTLPPLLLHTFINQDATDLSGWAKGLGLASEHTTFFNFTASHDGIGVRPLEGILPKASIDRLVEAVKQNGGAVSYKRNTDGTESPYELNITYVDALSDCTTDSDPYHTSRFLASQAIQYALPGVPATYIQSLLGSRNWYEGVEQTGRARTINREKLSADQVLTQLKELDGFRAKIFFPYLKLIDIRRKQPAFHPNATFDILAIDSKIFGIKRSCPEQTIYALTNISSQEMSVSLAEYERFSPLKDLFTGRIFESASIPMNAFQSVWLTPSG
jgi:glucosylglycerate phosphorylase